MHQLRDSSDFTVTVFSVAQQRRRWIQWRQVVPRGMSGGLVGRHSSSSSRTVVLIVTSSWRRHVLVRVHDAKETVKYQNGRHTQRICLRRHGSEYAIGYTVSAVLHSAPVAATTRATLG